MPLTVLASTNNGARVSHPEQHRMAALSTEGRLISAETGHYIHWDDPVLVISEIRRMIQEVRSER